MVITIKSIFKLSSILALGATIILLLLGITEKVEVPTPALIILTTSSVIFVSLAFVPDKTESKQG